MEQIENGKGANQLWRESGTTLSFAEWIQREKDKGRFLPNKMVDSIANSIKSDLGIDVPKETIVKKDTSIVGLSKPIIAVSIFIVIGAIAYTIYKKIKK